MKKWRGPWRHLRQHNLPRRYTKQSTTDGLVPRNTFASQRRCFFSYFSKARNADASLSERPRITAERIPFEIEVHGHKRIDEYDWMKDAGVGCNSEKQAKLIKYLESENSFTESVMGEAGPWLEFEKQVYKESMDEAVADFGALPESVGGKWEYFTKIGRGGLPVYCRRCVSQDDEGRGELEVILDHFELQQTHSSQYVDLGMFRVTNDHRLLAYTLDTEGSEEYGIYIRDLCSQAGAVEVDRIPKAKAISIEWLSGVNEVSTNEKLSSKLPVSDYFLAYTTVGPDSRPYRVWSHRVTDDPGADYLVYEESDPAFLVDISLTKDKQYLSIRSSSRTTSEISFLKTLEFGNQLEHDEGNRHVIEKVPEIFKSQVIQPRQQGVEYFCEHVNGRVIQIQSASDANNYEVRRSDPQWKSFPEVLVEQDPLTVITDFDIFSTHLVLYCRHKGKIP